MRSHAVDGAAGMGGQHQEGRGPSAVRGGPHLELVLQLLPQFVGGRQVSLEGAAPVLGGAALVLRGVHRHGLLPKLPLGLLVSVLHAARPQPEARGRVACIASAAAGALAHRGSHRLPPRFRPADGLTRAALWLTRWKGRSGWGTSQRGRPCYQPDGDCREQSGQWSEVL